MAKIQLRISVIRAWKFKGISLNVQLPVADSQQLVEELETITSTRRKPKESCAPA